MALTHKHFKDAAKLPPSNKPFTGVSSKETVISKEGKTLMVWEGSGCLGVVMSGAGKWGVMAHLHQEIQLKGLRLDLALRIVAKLVQKEMGKIEDVLLFFGDPDGSFGQKQGMDLPVATIKTLMDCENVIDLRRPKGSDGKKAPWGNDCVYDPGQKIVYTALPGSGGMLGGDELSLDRSKFSTFPFEKDDKQYEKLVKPMSAKGYFIVP